MLQLVNLQKTFANGRTVLQEVNLEVATGEILTIIGPSGSGKTTLLRLLCGFEPVSGGQVLYGGQSILHLSPSARQIAFVPQSPVLWPNQTVRAQLWFGLKQRIGMSVWRRGWYTISNWLHCSSKNAPWKRYKEELELRVERTAAVLGLSHLMECRPDQLSGGERQRVALARAWVRQPAVLLLDEPFAHLDPPARRQLQRQLADWHRQLGGTILLVTHDHDEALSLGHRVAVLVAGQLVQADLPQTVYNRPATVTVAQFLGALPMNLLTGYYKPDFITSEPSTPYQNNGVYLFDIGATPVHQFSKLYWIGEEPPNDYFPFLTHKDTVQTSSTETVHQWHLGCWPERVRIFPVVEADVHHVPQNISEWGPGWWGIGQLRRVRFVGSDYHYYIALDINGDSICEICSRSTVALPTFQSNINTTAATATVGFFIPAPACCWFEAKSGKLLNEI